jgi:hypothetical protein
MFVHHGSADRCPLYPREALDRWHQPDLAFKNRFRDGETVTMITPSLRSWSSIVASGVGEMAIRELRQSGIAPSSARAPGDEIL